MTSPTEHHRRVALWLVVVVGMGAVAFVLATLAIADRFGVDGWALFVVILVAGAAFGRLLNWLGLALLNWLGLAPGGSE